MDLLVIEEIHKMVCEDRRQPHEKQEVDRDTHEPTATTAFVKDFRGAFQRISVIAVRKVGAVHRGYRSRLA